MNELIKLTQQTLNDEQVNTVNARELHEFLGSQRQFADWIKKLIEDYGFIENQDFCIISQKSETIDKRGRAKASLRHDYFLTIDTAKEVCMVQRNDKGREARQYFIECEKQLRQVLSPKSNYQLGIINASTEIDRMVALNEYEIGYVRPLEQFREEAQPKVTYHDMVLQSEDLMTITQIANDYPISNQKLNKILAEKGVQYKDKSGIWIIKAAYNDKGLAQTETFSYETNGKIHAKQHLKWTQKGRLFIYELLKQEGILPVTEA